MIDDPKPGQEVNSFPELPESARHGRAYTLRRYDRFGKAIEVDVTLHCKGMFARWAARVELGAEVESSLPCGVCKIPAGGRCCIFTGDETAAPAILTILQSLPSRLSAEAYIKVEEAADIPAEVAGLNHNICWLSREAGNIRWAHLLRMCSEQGLTSKRLTFGWRVNKR